MEISRTVNDQPVSAQQLAALAVHNQTLQAIFDQAVARLSGTAGK